MNDANDYRQHAEKIRRLVASVRGHAATAALLLAEEYEARADQLEGRPMAAAYVGNVDRIGELVATERETIDRLQVREADLLMQIDKVRHDRVIAEARIESILKTARMLDMPNPPRRAPAPPSFAEAEIVKPPGGNNGNSNGI